MKRERATALAIRVYAALLRLYPPEFRQHYGADMLQVFRDSCRDADGLARLWLAALADLLVNASAERAKQMLTRRWLRHALTNSVAGAAFALSSFMLAIAVMLFTYFLLIPWDEGRIPEGTLAAAVNCFFESDGILLPSFVVTICLIIAVTRVTRQRSYSAIRIYNHFSLLNIGVTVIGAVVTQVSKIVIGRIFPNPPIFEQGYGFTVDPAYGTAVVYCGLVVIGAIIAFFVRLAWRPPRLPLIRRRTPQIAA